jgi:hypothetical protein
MTIEIQTFVPSAKATTSANVFHRLSVVSSATGCDCTTRPPSAPALPAARRR